MTDEINIERIKMDTKTQKYSDNNAICPWCDKEQSDSWELNDEGGETECSYCGKKFIYSVYHSTSYTTSLPDEELDKRVLEKQNLFGGEK